MTRLPVSVLIPFRNAGEYLHESLESLSRQSFFDFEVICVNDSSDDTSVAIVESWSGRDSRFRMVNNEGQGLVDALNTGLRNCRGEWVARMDADDVAHPQRIEEQLKTAIEGGIRQVVTCMVRSFPDSLVTDGYRDYENWLNGLCEPEEIRRNIFVESPVPHPTAFYHRESVLSRGGYVQDGVPEDYELWLRLWSLGFSFRRVPRILLYWRERPDRFSRISGSYSLTSFYRLKARYLHHVPCMRGRRIYVAGGGQTARRLGRCLARNGFEIRAFIAPADGRSGDRLLGRPVLSPGQLDPKTGIPVVIASRRPGVRDSVRKYLQDMGMEEWTHFVACS